MAMPLSARVGMVWLASRGSLPPSAAQSGGTRSAAAVASHQEPCSEASLTS